MSEPASVPAMAAPPRKRDNPWTRSKAGVIGGLIFLLLTVACLGTLRWTLKRVDIQSPDAALLPPTWLMSLPDDWADGDRWGTAEARAENREVWGYRAAAVERAGPGLGASGGESGGEDVTDAAGDAQRIRAHAPTFWLGTDKLGRDVWVRCLAGGGVSIGVGLAAATISVVIGTAYGALAGYIGGRTDSLMMRIVDILYGLPYVLLVVLLAVAGDSLVDRFAGAKAERALVARNAFVVGAAYERATAEWRDSAGSALTLEGSREVLARVGDEKALRPAVASLQSTEEGAKELDGLILALSGGDAERRQTYEDAATAAVKDGVLPSPALDESTRSTLRVLILLVAIGGVSWLTMARVIRGQVLSLKQQPYMEAARALGISVPRQFARHMLPNLLAPIIVYATLTVPQAILQESFLSFLGIGIQPPLPSWGNLAAEGLAELNTVRSRWWLLVFPCALLGTTLLALNFMGEGLREAFDPKRTRS
ncbi:MAG: ABC transporter permease [Phycisphaeraceae bacterium]|nr:ABC transporter permease [Phycisphaerales bacterium]MCB9843225.1 ABC transporter permease [Phycisphaeraceae bacterium]